MSKFPASWKKQIWAAFKELNIEDDNAERKLEALIQAISENLAGRPEHEWQDGLSWIDNAISEHNRAPFRGILAKQKSKICAEIITENCVDADHPIWNVPSDAVVQRTPNGLAEAVGPLLGMATKIVFVDYMLGMEKPRYRRAMAAYLNKVVTNRANGAIDQVEIITSAGGTAEFFEQTVRAELPSLIPAGLKVRVWKITPSHGGAALHNRYILTNRGGLKFGWG
ncbi:hypothetical protein N9C16_10680, partial [Paracoccaceae bacterium]|nr:hypothetical protein [Paracoccaceae bacterium]